MRWFCDIAGLPRRGPRDPDERRIARDLLRPRRGPARPAAGELPLGNDLRLRPDAPRRPEGRDPRRVSPRTASARSRRTRASGSASTRSRPRSPRIAPRAGRRFSSSATPERRTRARSTTCPALADLAARERLWFHVDAAYGGFFLLTEEGRRISRGDRARGLDRPRPAQGTLPAVRHRSAPRPRRRDAEARPRALGRVHALDAGGRGPDRLQPPLAGALPRLSRAADLAADPHARHRAVPAQPRGEAGARPVGRGAAARDPRNRDRGRAPAVDPGLPEDPARSRRAPRSSARTGASSRGSTRASAST